MTQIENLPAVAVSGGRDHTDPMQVWSVLSGLYIGRPFRLFVGDARGVDRYAREWAAANGIAHRVFVADWDRLGKSAGCRRNEEMLTASRDLWCLVAFLGGRGTGHAVYFANRIGLPVYKVGWAE
jgi:hypothetical protein